MLSASERGGAGRLAPAVFTCALLFGCGGGGGGGAQALPGGAPPPPPPPPAQSSVSITIVVPPATTTQSARRAPRYVSSQTQSAALSVNGGQPVVANLTASSPNCSISAQGISCTVSAAAPVGNDTLSVRLYGQPNAQGPILSQATTAANIAANAANTVTLTLHGVVAKIVLALANPSPAVGTAAQIALTATMYDAAGAAIVGDPFDNPVTLTDSDTSGATSLSKTALTSPADAVGLTVSYSGAAVGSVTFGATASGVTSVTPATLTPTTSQQSFVDWPTYAFDNQRDGFNPASTALSPSSLGQLHLAWQQNQSGDYNTQSVPVLATNVANHAGLLFVGGAQGIVYAYDALSGAQVWQQPLGTEQITCDGIDADAFSLGIGGSVAYDPGSRTLYAPSNKNASVNGPATNSVVRLDAASGAVMGSVNVGAAPLGKELNVIHTAVTLANGLAYVGTSSTCDLSPWRGRVAAANANVSGAPFIFYTTYGQGGNYSGGGVWGWGGVSVDDDGAVYAGVGNADENRSPQAPFTQTNDETVGLGDHIIKLSQNLSTLINQNNPGYTFAGSSLDLDFSGTPVLFRPVGCSDMLVAAQGKAGELLIYDSLGFHLGPIARFRTAPSTDAAGDIGNAAWSPVTGLLYVTVSSGTGGSIEPPGMFALAPSGCNAATTFSVAWHTRFGPDSYIGNNIPRSAPTVTAGGVVLAGTPCSTDGNGGCLATIGSTFGGAMWALDATTGALLNNGKPILMSNAEVRAPPVVDGKWVFIEDNGATLYGLTVDPNVKAIAVVRRTPIRHSVRPAQRR